VSIGLMQGMEPVGGAVYDFWRKKLYWAAQGHGAWVDQTRLQPKPFERASNQILCIGVDAQNRYAKEVERFMQLRNLWCGSLEICYVAEGVFGASCYRAFWLWDWAGASALLRELGYRYQSEQLDDGKPHHYRYECYREPIVKKNAFEA